MAKPDEPDPAIAPGRKVTFEITWAPWLRWYRTGVLWFAEWSGMEPDPDRMAWWIQRGTRVKTVITTDDQ